MSHDPQKNRVYRWEQDHVAPLDKVNVIFNNLQQIVDYVWADLGLEHPPKVALIAKQNKKAWATATRLKIAVQETGCPTWVLLHNAKFKMQVRLGKFQTTHKDIYPQVFLYIQSVLF